MPSSIVAELWDAVADQLLAEGLELGDEVLSAMLGPGGEAPGDQAMSRGQRIARVQDLASRGVLDALAGICAAAGASHYDDMVSEYVRDVAESELVKGVR